MGAPERRSLMRLFQPNQRPPGGLCPSSYTQLSCKRPTATTRRPEDPQPVCPSHEGEPGATCAAGGPDRACAAGGPDRTTTTFSGLRRQRTPCSSDLAVVQRRVSQGVARELPSIRNLPSWTSRDERDFRGRTTASTHVLVHANLSRELMEPAELIMNPG